MKRTQEILRLLRDYESPNVLAIAPDLSAPVVWEQARGAQVWDAAGKKYLDLTAAFGVAAAGHANPRVVAAARRQMGVLLHAMGDVYPHARKAELARELSRITFERWTAGRPAESRLTGKTIFANSGFEAVEAALKTALLATGKPRILAFTGAYHGLGYGALNATHRAYFRAPFRGQLAGFGGFAPFPKESADLPPLERWIRKSHEEFPFGAVLAEPVQGRGGINVPPAGFLPLLRELCRELGALLILDEIYTGFGRTGKWFACEHGGVVPDLICLGKALTGGFPLSACVGRADLMDAAWPRSTGEAIHTSTFLGHPVGCAMALAQIKEIRSRNLPVRSAERGEFFLQELRAQVPPSSYRLEIRGLGLMAGVEIRRPDGAPASAAARAVLEAMLCAGYIVLPEGEASNIISFTPPLTITRAQLAAAARAFGQALRNLPAA
ncbi:MAG TPA: aspartate aminotransferase family protein [Candidatus Acidoferrum sp.]|nr:aspartate aminotransferase family protein [Candidatus Acidoferrum sp.]